MKLIEKLLNKIKNELSIEDLNTVILHPIYDMIYNKISPYYIILLLLLSIIIILLIIILCYIIFKY
jgi:hypothetical protein